VEAHRHRALSKKYERTNSAAAAERETDQGFLAGSLTTVFVSFFSTGGAVTFVSFFSQAAISKAAPAIIQMYFFIDIIRLTALARPYRQAWSSITRSPGPDRSPAIDVFAVK
jgi:hypothetical protein